MLQPPAPPVGWKHLCDRLHPVDQVATGGRRRQRLAVLSVEIDCFLNDSAQLVKDDFFVIAVAASVNQPRGAAHVALILLGPLHDLDVSRTVLHFFDSSNGEAYSPHLVVLRIIARITRDCYRSCHVRVNEVPVAALAASVDEAGAFKLGYEFSYLGWHERFAC